jgi:DNA excision repair protein ERCC-2
MVTRELEAECVVVFDEGHNIDNICIEALSVQLDDRKLEAATRCVTKLSRSVEDLRTRDCERVRTEYDRLVQGLHSNNSISSGNDTDSIVGSASPVAVLPTELLDQAVPGNVRKAEHFLRSVEEQAFEAI